MGKPQRDLLDTIAQHLAVTWEQGDGPGAVRITRGRERIAVEIGEAEIPRLRFDKVALGLVRRLQAALNEGVPEGSTLIVTITAPIRVAAKTAAALEDELSPWLARRASGKNAREIRHTLHGNHIRARLVNVRIARTGNIISFVHNPDLDPTALLDLVQSLIERIAAAARSKR